MKLNVPWLLIAVLAVIAAIIATKFICREGPPPVAPVQSGFPWWKLLPDAPPITDPADSAAVVKVLRKRIAELRAKNTGLNAELTKARAQYTGVVTDTILKKVLDKKWPLVEVKAVTPRYIVWTGYKDGLLTTGRAPIHARRFTVVPDSMGGVTIAQPVVEFGLLARVDASTPPDTLVPHVNAAAYITMSRGPYVYGLGAGWSGKPEIRAFAQVQLP